MSALNKQVGGGHYKDLPIQPVEYITRNSLGFLEGCVVKRVTRWRQKDGLQDLRKAIHELELLIEEEERFQREHVAPANWGNSSFMRHPAAAAGDALCGRYDPFAPFGKVSA